MKWLRTVPLKQKKIESDRPSESVISYFARCCVRITNNHLLAFANQSNVAARRISIQSEACAECENNRLVAARLDESALHEAPKNFSIKRFRIKSISSVGWLRSCSLDGCLSPANCSPRSSPAFLHSSTLRPI